MPKTSQRLAKRTSNGRFVSIAEAHKLLAEQQQVCDEYSGVNNVPEQPAVVMLDPRSNVSRRTRTEMSERVAKKFRSLELAYEGERARTANLVEKLAAQRLEFGALQKATKVSNDNKKALSACRQLLKDRASELKRVKDNLRKCKDANSSYKAKAAAHAVEVARRVLARVRAVKATHGRKMTYSEPVKKMIPPNDDAHARARYDFIRNNAVKLQGFFASQFRDGSEGEAALETLAYFLARRQDFSAKLVQELGIPFAIEAQVVQHLQRHWAPEDGAAMKHNSCMTWRGYKCWAGQTFRKWCPERNTWVMIPMPYGGQPPQPPRAYKVQQVHKDICMTYGLQQSDDGLTAWCNVVKVLQARLEAIPAEQLPAAHDSLRVWFGADAFRCYEANSLKMVMCVAKPMIERRTKEGNLRMEGWVTNSHQNHLRMAIYEGGDSYSEFCTKGSVVQRQLQELASKTFQIKGQGYNVRVGLFGDMAFLDCVLGGSGCSYNHACLLCEGITSWFRRRASDVSNSQSPS